MKQKIKIVFTTSFIMLAHYFVLTYFKVDGVESFTGKVEQIESAEKGFFPSANVKLVIEEDHNGEKQLVSKTISLIKNDLYKIKIGKQYSFKSHKNWLVFIR
jgi:hypothetical protein